MLQVGTLSLPSARFLERAQHAEPSNVPLARCLALKGQGDRRSQPSSKLCYHRGALCFGRAPDWHRRMSSYSCLLCPKPEQTEATTLNTKSCLYLQKTTSRPLHKPSLFGSVRHQCPRSPWPGREEGPASPAASEGAAPPQLGMYSRSSH